MTDIPTQEATVPPSGHKGYRRGGEDENIDDDDGKFNLEVDDRHHDKDDEDNDTVN